MIETPAILIVDDREANLRLYQAVLKDAGAELHTARSGAEALVLSRERSYAMVLLDVHLPDMNGFDVARAMRQSETAAQSPIVFVSAVYTHESDAFRGYRAGAVDYILSPVVPEVLRAKVAAFIGLQRRRIEAQQQSDAADAAYRELRAAHTELEHFSWSVSHDLRTPLSHAAGFVELLRMHAGAMLDDKGRGYLDQIGLATVRMESLIDDLLTLAHISRTELQRTPVDLSELAREAALALEQSSGGTRRVSWDVADGLRTDGDARLLRTALTNLLGNAWKYSAAIPSPSIGFDSIDSSEGEKIFVISDNGPGFDVAGAGERLFRPFQRFHADAAFKGTGVGLAIVHRVVTLHGGRIWAESTPGRGARFFFTLFPPRRRGATRFGDL